MTIKRLDLDKIGLLTPENKNLGRNEKSSFDVHFSSN